MSNEYKFPLKKKEKNIKNNGRSPGVNPGSPSKCPYRFAGRDAPRCLQTPVGPARDNPGSPCGMTPCSGEARFQRGGTPGSFGDWLYHFRGEISARRHPRFIRRLALSFSGRDCSAATTPVHSAIGFIIFGKGEISARANNPGSPGECLFFSLLLFFLGKEKKRTKQKPMRRAGPREAITCVQINHEVEQRTTPPPTPCCLL